MGWYEQAEAQIEESYARGEIDYAEYRDQMKALNDDLRGEAEEAAERAYRDAMGWY